jgi:peptide/nickel transport system permease protein
MKNWKKNKISSGIVIFMIIIGIMYPILTPYSADDFSFDSLLRPSFSHLLGTDEMGHDIFSMVLAGFRVTIGISILSAFLSTSIGIFFGILCAYYKGWVDKVIMKVTELFIIVPEIVVLLFIAAFAEPEIHNTILAISFSHGVKLQE